MKNIKIFIITAALISLLAACGNNNKNSATPTPEVTSTPGNNVMDDAGNAVKDTGDAVGDAVKDAGDAVGDATKGVTDTAGDMIEGR